MVMKKVRSEKTRKRLVRKIRIRNLITGTETKPRISVFRSNKHISVQAVDDEKGVTLCSVSSLGKNAQSATVAKAKELGEELAAKLAGMNISMAVYDRNGFLYHGQVAAVAEGLRAKGIRI
jgi:large subunit ribosomal protein L18